jgi:hypothetical protein
VVGCFAHCRDDDDDIVATALGERNVFRHRTNAIRIRNRRAAIFLNDQCHEYWRLVEVSRVLTHRFFISFMSKGVELFGGKTRNDGVGFSERGDCATQPAGNHVCLTTCSTTVKDMRSAP